MKYLRTSLICIFLMQLSFPVKAEKSDSNGLTDILLINSYHYTFKWTNDITNAVVKELPEADDYRISIEYLDTKRFSFQRQEVLYVEYLKEKYRTLDIKGIICSDNDAFEFVLKHGKEIWGDVPVTFCGVNELFKYDINSTNYFGVEEEIAIAQTLELILTLQPDLKELIVVSDSTLNGILFADQFLRAARAINFPVDYDLIYATSVELLGETLKEVDPEKRAILLLSLYLPRNGAVKDMILEADFLKSCLDVPVYGTWDFLFGGFILGGVINTGEEQGRLAAQLLKRKLAGETFPPGYLVKSTQTMVVDYNKLKYYNIDLSLVPKNALVLHEPENYFRKYRQEILIVCSVLGFLIVINIILLRLLNEKRIAEAKLRKSEERLELALDGANVGLWDIDLENKAVYINKWVSGLLGYGDSGIAHVTIGDWIKTCHPDDLGQVNEVLHMHLSGKVHDFNTEARLQTSSGEYKWFSLHGKVVEVDQNSTPRRMIGLMLDIDMQKQFEEQLRIAKEKAEESDRLKSSFLANVSHEIRTPMNAILGFSDILLDASIQKEDSLKFLSLIRSSGESLLALINDIIDISKIESGQFNIVIGKFDLHLLFDKISHIASTLINTYNRDIELIIEKGVDQASLFIESDQYRLEQIINNLISNAIKFTSRGHVILSYTIPDNNTLEIRVTDTGRGISKEDQGVIFERFRQINPDPKINIGGTGLGLAISKSITELLGGTICVDSAPDQGATFRVRIPCKYL
jgi:PAS domain S-box-containing protein